jgi:tetratricopeptide (TPR) repeat protein
MTPRRLRPLLCCAVALCGQVLLGSGCATLRAVPLERSSRLLVVAEGAADAGAALEREADVVRALSLVPLRAWPTDAEAALAEDLRGDAPGRVERARQAAEERRLPWLLILDEEGARLETSRTGDVIWRTRVREGDEPEARLAARIHRGLGGSGRRGLGGPGEVRLLPRDRLHALRQLAVDGRWQDYSDSLDALVSEWPADPALRTHLGLRAWLTSGSVDLSGLRLAASMVEGAESELLATALMAEEAGAVAVSLEVRTALVRLHPDRIDYRPPLADAQELLDRPEDALSACRGGLAAVDGEALLELPKGTAPDQAPLALPYADVAFCTGYLLFSAGSWELSAVAYEDAVTLYEALGLFRELGETLNNLGVAMVQAERPLMGASALRKAVDVREELGTPLPLANSRYNLGRALSDANKPGGALLSYRRAAEDYRAGGEPIEALTTLVETLDLYVRQDDPEGFAEAGDTILAAVEELPEDEERERLVGDVWFELGRGRFTFGDAQGAVAAYLRSLRTWEGIDARLEQGQAHYSLALPHLALFEFDQAHTDLVRALEISVELSDSSSILAIRQQLEEIESLMEQAGKPIPPIPKELLPWLPGRPPR